MISLFISSPTMWVIPFAMSWLSGISQHEPIPIIIIQSLNWLSKFYLSFVLNILIRLIQFDLENSFIALHYFVFWLSWFIWLRALLVFDNNIDFINDSCINIIVWIWAHKVEWLLLSLSLILSKRWLLIVLFHTNQFQL